MRAAEQPESVPSEFLERVTQWAQSQPDPVSVILFGSRARGDHGPESDWDFALVFEGECPSLKGLPSTLEGRDVDWAPIERSRAMHQLNVCGIQHAVAADGRCLHGVPLPSPKRRDVNTPAVWHYLFEAHGKIRDCLHSLADHWGQSPEWRPQYNTSVAERSALAGELLGKAALNMRGVEPRRSHSVAELCDELERECPADPLLPSLRGCDGLTSRAHVNVYTDLDFQREAVGVSARRLASVLRAFGEVWATACDASWADEGRDGMGRLTAVEDKLRDEVRGLCSSDCPQGILHQVQAALDAWPDTSALWDRLLAAPSGSDSGQGSEKAG